jgi:hypothetical protein
MIYNNFHMFIFEAPARNTPPPPAKLESAHGDAQRSPFGGVEVPEREKPPNPPPSRSRPRATVFREWRVSRS